MNTRKQHLLPTGQSAFAFAVRPFSDNHVDHRSGFYLLSPAETESTDEESSVFSRPRGGDQIAEWVGTAHSDDSPEYRSDIVARIKAKPGPFAALRYTLIHTMLMRCQMFQSIIQSIAGKPWVKDGGTAIDQYYDTMRQLACKAGQMAEGLQDQGLRARCEHWAGRACAGTNDLLAAVGHLKCAQRLDISRCSSLKDGIQMLGLTFRGKHDLGFLLKAVTELIEAQKGDNYACLPDRENLDLRKFTSQEQFYIQHGKKMHRQSQRPEQASILEVYIPATWSTLSLASESSVMSSADDSVYDPDLDNETMALERLFAEEPWEKI